jgi:hypothetical protein
LDQVFQKLGQEPRGATLWRNCNGTLTHSAWEHEGCGRPLGCHGRGVLINRIDWNDQSSVVVRASLEPFGFPAKGHEKTPSWVGLASD